MRKEDINELPGKQFDYLTVIKTAPFKIKFNKKGEYKVRYWECLCICGKIRIIAHGDLMKKNRIKSCGCKSKEITRNAIEKATTLRYLNRNCNKEEFKLYNQYKYSDTVTKKNKPFLLSLQDFISTIYKNCYYCGILNRYNGIDRIDSNKGYLMDNVVPCCTHCNRAKMDRSVEDFKKWIKLTYNNLYNK